MNNSLMVLIGPAGSGKTTFAKEYIQKNPGWVRVSRDDLRKQVLGERDFGSYFKENNLQLEKHITSLQMEQIRYWLMQDFNVLIDNPHLKIDYLFAYQHFFGHMADILFVPMRDIDSATCKTRIINREGSQVDVSYVDRHFENFQRVLLEAADVIDKPIYRRNDKRFKFSQLQKTTSKDCIIVDIDGSIANSGWRKRNEGEKMTLDKPITQLHFLLNQIKGKDPSKFTVVYLTGRDEKWRDQTIQWLKKNEFPWDNELHMRKSGDLRSEIAVKTDLLFEKIAGKFRPIFAIDDHLQVCHGVWYKLGIFCLNVNQGLKA
jgi:adenylate kinase family enzyme